MERLTKTYSDGTHGASDNLPCGENSYTYKGLLLEALGKYEDAEEQGLLLKLHLKVGDTVYYVISTMKNPIDFQIVKIEIFQDEIIYVDDGDNEWSVEDFGKLVFLTQAEAEQRLKEMGSD